MATLSQLLGAQTDAPPGGSGGPPPGRVPHEPQIKSAEPSRGLGVMDVLPWTLPLLGMALQRSVRPELVAQYRAWMARAAREAAPHTPMPAGDWVPRLLRGAWWHGTPNPATILEKGFDPAFVGKGGIRFGEPHGISLSASPHMAEDFAGGPSGQILRVWPNVDPKSVLPVWGQEAAGPLHKAYMTALEKPLAPGYGGGPSTIAEYLAGHMPLDVKPTPGMLQLAMESLRGEDPTVVQHFNKLLADELKKQGVQGLMYSPRRYGEYEMRVLDPHKAVPLEVRKMERGLQPAPHSPAYIPFAGYAKPKSGQLKDFLEAAPKEPTSLSDLYKLIDPRRILRLAEEPARTPRAAPPPRLPPPQPPKSAKAIPGLALENLSPQGKAAAAYVTKHYPSAKPGGPIWWALFEHAVENKSGL